MARQVIGGLTEVDLFTMGVRLAICLGVVCAFLVRGRALLLFAVITVLSIGAHPAGEHTGETQTWRSFFGVLRHSSTHVPALGGPVRMLSHGTTLHGAQAIAPRWRCNPLVYYATSTPIGQVFLAEQRVKPAMRIGAVGLGTGSVSAYVRASDRLTFFEIDPQVIRISSDPAHFSYTTLRQGAGELCAGRRPPGRGEAAGRGLRHPAHRRLLLRRSADPPADHRGGARLPHRT